MKSILILIAVIVLGHGFVLAQTGSVVIPGTAAGKRLSALISAYNSGDDVKLEAFFSTAISEDLLKKMSAKERLDGHRKLRKDVGGTLEPLEIKLSTEFEIQAVLRSKYGTYLTYSVTTATAAPNKITSNRIDLLPNYQPSSATAKTAGNENNKVAGTWEGIAKSETRGDIPFTMKLKAAGSITGEIESPVGVLSLAEVKVTAEKISMVFNTAEGLKLSFSGILNSNKITGEFNFADQEKGKFECTKK